MLYSVREARSHSLSRAESVGPFIRETLTLCSVFNRHAHEMALNFIEMSPRWLHDLFRQEPALKRHQTVPKPEVGEAAEISGEDEYLIVYAISRSVQRARRECKVIFLFL